MATLNSHGIRSISLSNSPYFFTLKNQTIALIAINLIMSRDSSIYQIPSTELKQKLRFARVVSNIVIVSVHWGSELLEWPDTEQRDAAQWLIANGADIIIGHHPHVIQKPELIDGKPVFFSLGNHLFDQKYECTKTGLIAEIEIKKNRIYCKGIKTHTQRNSFYPEFDGHAETYFKPITFSTGSFTANGLTIIPENIDIVNKIMLKAYKKGRLLWKSHPIALVTLQKANFDGHEYLFALNKYHSSIDNEVTIRPYVYTPDTMGIVARWRGSALAWPIVDAQIPPHNDQILCALHRGDNFISIGKITAEKTVAAYKWNGFGFDVVTDSLICADCWQLFR